MINLREFQKTFWSFQNLLRKNSSYFSWWRSISPTLVDKEIHEIFFCGNLVWKTVCSNLLLTWVLPLQLRLWKYLLLFLLYLLNWILLDSLLLWSLKNRILWLLLDFLLLLSLVIYPLKINKKIKWIYWLFDWFRTSSSTDILKF